MKDHIYCSFTNVATKIDKNKNFVLKDLSGHVGGKIKLVLALRLWILSSEWGRRKGSGV